MGYKTKQRGYKTKQRILNRGISNSQETLKEMFNIVSPQENANQNKSVLHPSE